MCVCRGLAAIASMRERQGIARDRTGFWHVLATICRKPDSPLARQAAGGEDQGSRVSLPREGEGGHASQKDPAGAGRVVALVPSQAAAAPLRDSVREHTLNAAAGLRASAGGAGAAPQAGRHTRLLGALSIPEGDPAGSQGDTWGFARIWGISSPASAVHLSDFATPHSLTNSTSGFYSAHNPQIRGSTLYISWYSDGLRIVDISNPTRPTEVGFYRPKPTLDPTGVFQAFGPAGAHPIPFVWGVYPLGSRIYLSDINYGLYIVEETA
jgi:hypothetical protein